MWYNFDGFLYTFPSIFSIYYYKLCYIIKNYLKNFIKNSQK